MIGRCREGRPPVPSVADLVKLRAWFRENRDWLAHGDWAAMQANGGQVSLGEGSMSAATTEILITGAILDARPDHPVVDFLRRLQTHHDGDTLPPAADRPTHSKSTLADWSFAFFPRNRNDLL